MLKKDIERTREEEPADFAALVLHAIGSRLLDVPGKAALLKKVLAFCMAEQVGDIYPYLLFADRFHGAGMKRAAARLASLVLAKAMLENSWELRNILASDLKNLQGMGVPPGLLEDLLLSNVPLYPPGVFGSNFYYGGFDMLEKLAEVSGPARPFTVLGETIEALLEDRGRHVSNTHIMIASLLYRAGKKKKALDAALRALELALKRRDHLDLEKFLQVAGKDKECAVAVFRKVKGMVKDLPPRCGSPICRPIATVAMKLFDLGLEKEGREAWDLALNLVPKEDAQALYSLGSLALRGKRKDLAVPILLPLLSEARVPPSNVAGLVEKIGGEPKYRKCIAEGLERYKEFCWRKDLALVSARFLPREKASELIEKALRENPGDKDLLRALKEVKKQ